MDRTNKEDRILTFQEIWETYPKHREEMEERAAINEFDGTYTRAEAEYETAKLMHKKYLLFRQKSLFDE